MTIVIPAPCVASIQSGGLSKLQERVAALGLKAVTIYLPKPSL